VKRIGKNSGGPAQKRSPKLPDELVPIVDAVVEVVFERLRSATTGQPSATKGPPASRKTAKLNLPLPKQRTALAEALADLLLADLASRARTDRAKPRNGRAKPVSRRRGPAPPKARRARP
jgi:hypothetical protein